MRFCNWLKRDPTKNYFLVPNEIFCLGLTSGEISVYSYLLRCENRKTYQCWPSYRTIGKATKMSPNTVRKYVAMLEERRLIRTEPTSVITKDGRKRNGNLLYTIRPIQEAVDYFHRRQLEWLEIDIERRKAEKKITTYDQQEECPA
jgi:DNA-binding transcriptional regulator YhcF (GntR family)